MNKNLKFLVQAAVIAAIYAVLTIALGSLGSQVIQVRVSEAMTVLPFLTPAAIPGLFVGCIISNIVTGAGIWDVIFGSLATLLAAFATYKMPKKILAPLPPVIINAVVVGVLLGYLYSVPYWFAILTVGAGELISCYVIGYPLLLVLEKYKEKLFFKTSFSRKSN
ncbi:QueT transporter [Oxobacter pfennigii]|uniref:QueT transporter n=1 Tax=Oxobacter pfennigii TaxID=36849 RepID=A0A0P9AL81_9CLOT|nr:QueT transporter family protein [Oxobacter pfennigii]KPU46122.1 QueT transporter [Oxobacter pfennigii]